MQQESVRVISQIVPLRTVVYPRTSLDMDRTLDFGCYSLGNLFIFLILHQLNQLLQNFKIIKEIPFKMRLGKVFRPFLKRSLAYLVSV